MASARFLYQPPDSDYLVFAVGRFFITYVTGIQITERKLQTPEQIAWQNTLDGINMEQRK